MMVPQVSQYIDNVVGWDIYALNLPDVVGKSREFIVVKDVSSTMV